jgi:hypothetical protein
MSIGAVHDVALCSSTPIGRPVRIGGVDATCERSDGTTGTLQTVEVYQIDPAHKDTFEGFAGPVDSGTVSAVFSLGFGMVIACYFVAHVVGTVVQMIRRG